MSNITAGSFIRGSGSAEMKTYNNNSESAAPVAIDNTNVLSMSGADDRWLKFNPLDEPSERELVCELDWRRVWRRIYVRNSTPVPHASL